MQQEIINSLSQENLKMEGPAMPSGTTIQFVRITLLAVFCTLTVLGSTETVKAQDAGSPYLGQIAIVAFDFVPRGWHACDGTLLQISQHSALFSLLGTTYGGDGRTTFALPDLRGRVPVHAASSIQLGEEGGEEMHTLTVAEMPSHSHVLRVSDSVGNTAAINTFLARPGDLSRTTGVQANTTLNTNSLGNAGSTNAHENRMPYQTLRYIIAIEGVFPSRN